MKSGMPGIKSTLFLCLHYVLQYAAPREVTVPEGPLYRVAGFSLSVPCSVSGYEGPRMQDFEWFLYKDDSNGKQMGVVSTKDKGFPYAPYLGRVRNGEVRVDRDSGDHVRLVMQRLRTDDQGKYECYTPSTDSVYLGSYSGSVVVKVIDDTLQISHSRSLTGQPLPEGAELTLTCSASINSKQLTHLSVTFGKRDGQAGSGGAAGPELSSVREIISIDKLLGVVPGRNYKKRYDDGDITLEKRNVVGGQDLYIMKIKVLQTEDTGAYFCEAAQWIRDPDVSWQKIAHRALDIGNLTVTPLSESLSVTSTPRGEVTLQVGSPLLLTCEVNGLPSDVNSGLQVQWMKRGSAGGEFIGSGGVEVEVAKMSPDGVVTWGDDVSRASGGSMEKVAEARYSLKLFSARPSDSGVYRCVVSVYAGRRSPAPSTPATLTQKSEGVTVNLKTKDVVVSAEAQLARGPLLKRGSTITLLCTATITTTGPAQAQVQWFRWPILELRTKSPESPTPEPTEPKLVAALTYDGVVEIYVNGSEVSMDRLSPVQYRLRVHAATVEDQGMYACHAEAWGQDPHGGWYNSGVKAESNAVTVYLYARVADLLLIPLVVGVSSALLVGIVIIAAVTCCFMKRLAKQRARR
ncbi:immunoglobulin superfamily member 8 [Syngnathus typhle]|uniref:immunoglobulin superfamily member 8 n=1 Tax=Syngnathus typhle TaxID=161592 RepID=UPI002A6AE789|nr:immunoglobulin superfamily member 8 [Syngnathus typhle]XP_061147265.1 immunoglobulin superfamily member 8 [Syngnathus typhle]